MKSLIVVLLVTCSLYGNIEIIELSEELSKSVIKKRWTSLASGGLYLDSLSLYLSDENLIYIQSRDKHSGVKVLHVSMNGSEAFKVIRILPTRTSFYLTLFMGNGRLYLSHVEREGLTTKRVIEKHGYAGKMSWFNERVYVGGLYWPEYAGYLDKFKAQSGNKISEMNRRSYEELFKTKGGFTLTVYDNALARVDSVNEISRTGEDAHGFMLLYVPQPYDINTEGDIFLIDNEKGYVVKRYRTNQGVVSEFKIENQNYMRLPEILTNTSAKQLKVSDKGYSVAYGLYEKQDFILSCFYQSSPPPTVPEPPFYYDVSTKTGELVKNGVLPYPIVGEDEKEKVFFYKKIEGGWFGRDRVFLIGMTISDIIDGKATIANIDAAVIKYISN